MIVSALAVDDVAVTGFAVGDLVSGCASSFNAVGFGVAGFISLLAVSDLATDAFVAAEIGTSVPGAAVLPVGFVSEGFVADFVVSGFGVTSRGICFGLADAVSVFRTGFGAVDVGVTCLVAGLVTLDLLLGTAGLVAATFKVTDEGFGETDVIFSTFGVKGFAAASGEVDFGFSG